MKVPIVTGRQALALSVQPRNAARTLRAAQSASPQDDDAVRLALSGASGAQLPAAGVRYDGELPSLLKSIGDLAQHISDLQSADGKDGASAQQRSARAKEIEQLTARLKELSTGPSAQRLRDLVNGVSSALASGASTDAVAGALASQQGALGSNFVNLVRQGATSNITAIAGFFNSLGSIDGTNTSALADAAVKAQQSLVSGVSNASSTGEAAAAAEDSETSPLTLTETKFQAGSNIALGIRGYGSRDLIKAAATGQIKDLSLINQLTIERPPSDEEREREKKKQDKQRSAGGNLSVSA